MITIQTSMLALSGSVTNITDEQEAEVSFMPKKKKKGHWKTTQTTLPCPPDDELSHHNQSADETAHTVSDTTAEAGFSFSMRGQRVATFYDISLRTGAQGLEPTTPT